MKLTSTARAFKIGLNNFVRNIGINFATIVITTLTLFVISTVIILNIIGSTAIKSLEDKIDVSVYLKSESVDDDVNKIISYLNTKEQVKEINLTTKEEALSRLQTTYEANPAIVESLYLIGNPLQPTISFKTKSFDDYDAIVTDLESDKFSNVIDTINYQDNKKVIEKLATTTNAVQKSGFGISIVFVIVAVLVIFNTIRLTIFTQKEEIEIMRLVGATGFFIRLPYLIEGIIYGLISSIISLVALAIMIKKFNPFIEAFFEGEAEGILAFMTNNIWQILLWQLVLGIVLAVISSYISVWKYIRK
ncbi:MAG: permease-like cell division protein FtsX [bacterium]